MNPWTHLQVAQPNGLQVRNTRGTSSVSPRARHFPPRRALNQ
jgi:hypothetical protein